MDEILRIGSTEYRKTGHGVFEVRLSELGDLHFVDVRHYSTVEVSGLPATSDSYRLDISATHGGGPHNEDFTLYLHVGFQQSYDDPMARKRCDIRLDRIRRTFRAFVAEEIFSDGGGHEHRTPATESWLCQMLYSRQFSRKENPRLVDFIRSFVARFEDLLRTPDFLLFICHASEDKAFVDRMAAHLDAHNLSLWYDKREIKVGDSIVGRISEGLDAASHLIIVLSATSVTKPWVQKELSSALIRQLKDRSITIVPLLREECRVPPLLTDIKYVDCRTSSHAGFNDMVKDLTTDAYRPT